MQRTISCLMTLVLLTGIIFAIIILVIPEMVEAVNTLISRAPAQFRRLQAWIEPYFHYVPLLEDWINANLSDINWQEMLKIAWSFCLMEPAVFLTQQWELFQVWQQEL